GKIDIGACIEDADRLVRHAGGNDPAQAQLGIAPQIQLARSGPAGLACYFDKGAARREIACTARRGAGCGLLIPVKIAELDDGGRQGDRASVHVEVWRIEVQRAERYSASRPDINVARESYPVPTLERDRIEAGLLEAFRIDVREALQGVEVG